MTEELGHVMELKEKIKLMKMSKGYQWEISIFPKIDNFMLPSDIKRLQDLDIELRNIWGNEQ